MPPIAFQLYSARNAGPLGDLLAELASLGYDSVEGYGALYPTIAEAEALRKSLDEHELTMPTGHIGLDVIEGDPDTAIRIARALGLSHVIGPYLSPGDRPVGPGGWEAFARRLEAASEPIRAAGLGFGWHNHDFELENFGGRTPLDIILTGSTIGLELDIGWVYKAGHDPLAWIERTADRLIAVHLKDVAPFGNNAEDGWADLGSGEMEWGPILAALKDTSAQVFVVEHDNPSDASRFARNSKAFLS